MTDDRAPGAETNPPQPRLPADSAEGPDLDPVDRPIGHPDDRAGREPGELVTGLSPRQIIGGFALLAGLLIWLRRRGRKG